MSNVIQFLKENIEVNNAVIRLLSGKIEEASDIVANTLKSGKTIFIAGNGGSATMATHISGEFLGRFKKERKSLPSISLAADTAALTAIANDYGYDFIFSRQLEGLAKRGDLLITLTTSGNSENLIKAMGAAKNLSVRTISLSGKDGGRMKGMADLEIIIPSNNTPRIQETHLLILHIICELSEKNFME